MELGKDIDKYIPTDRGWQIIVYWSTIKSLSLLWNYSMFHIIVLANSQIYTHLELLLSRTIKYKISEPTTPIPQRHHVRQDTYNHGIYATCTSPIMHLICPQKSA